MTPSRSRESAVRVVTVYPELLGTYGDGGNGMVLARRLGWRGLVAELIEARAGEPVPASADIYCMGGGEDGPQAQAAALLIGDGGLTRAVAGGAVVLAVCAGFQLVGESFPGAGGAIHPGLGLLDVRTERGQGRRAVGEVLARPEPGAAAAGLSTDVLTGYENHAGRTRRGPGARALAHVEVGTGNGGGDRTEGAWSERIVGTYLHGPVLARNPALADFLLGIVLGPDTELAGLDDTEAQALRAERTAAVGWTGRPPRVRARLMALRSRGVG
ncbi:MAG: type 1 glutamine amidotransferase [Acidimicrobiales bacterium]